MTLETVIEKQSQHIFTVSSCCGAFGHIYMIFISTDCRNVKLIYFPCDSSVLSQKLSFKVQSWAWIQLRKQTRDHLTRLKAPEQVLNGPCGDVQLISPYTKLSGVLALRSVCVNCDFSFFCTNKIQNRCPVNSSSSPWRKSHRFYFHIWPAKPKIIVMFWVKGWKKTLLCDHRGL